MKTINFLNFSLKQLIFFSCVLGLLFLQSSAIDIKGDQDVEEEPDETAERGKALKEFEDWYLTQLGAAMKSSADDKKQAAKLKITLGMDTESDDLRAGVYAKENIKEGDEILKIPYNLMLTSSRILEATELGSTIKMEEDAFKTNLNDTDIIALYIMYLRFCSPEINPWALWINALPHEFNSILYFTESELKSLEGSPTHALAVREIDQAKKTLEFIEDKIVKVNPTVFHSCDSGFPSYEDHWRWARSVVKSRKVDLLNEKQEKFSTVVPFFDFFDHGLKPKGQQIRTWGHQPEHKFFHAEAMRPFKRGEEIFQFYGYYPNSKLLLDYGFIIEDNPYDSVFVEPHYLGVDPEDYLSEMKSKLLESYADKPEKLEILRGPSMTNELYQAVRIINSDENDFTEDGQLISEPSAETDFFASKWFRAVANHKLQQYPTTLEDDEKYVKTSLYTALSNRAKMAIQLRMAEKTLLKELSDAFGRKIQKIVEESQAQKAHDEL